MNELWSELLKVRGAFNIFRMFKTGPVDEKGVSESPLYDVAKFARDLKSGISITVRGKSPEGKDIELELFGPDAEKKSKNILKLFLENEAGFIIVESTIVNKESEIHEVIYRLVHVCHGEWEGLTGSCAKDLMKVVGYFDDKDRPLIRFKDFSSDPVSIRFELPTRQ